MKISSPSQVSFPIAPPHLVYPFHEDRSFFLQACRYFRFGGYFLRIHRDLSSSIQIRVLDRSDPLPNRQHFEDRVEGLEIETHGEHIHTHRHTQRHTECSARGVNAKGKMVRTLSRVSDNPC